MEVIELNTFRLEEYDNCNPEHRDTMVLLGNDTLVRKYIGYLDHFICDIQLKENELDNVYVVFFHEKPIGFIAFQIKEEFPEISYAILENYRHENISKLLLQQFTYYLQDIYSLDTIYVNINPSNIPSIKTAEFVGYKKETSIRYAIKNSSNLHL